MRHIFIGQFRRRNGEGGSLFAAGVSSLAIRGAGSITSFLLGVVLARSLGPQQFGIYGLVIALALLLSVFAQAGLPTLSTREIAVHASRREWPLVKGVLVAFGRFVWLASMAVGALLVIAIIAWPQLFGSGSIAYAAGAALVPLFALTVLLAGELRGFHNVVLSQSIDTLVRPALTLLCVGICITLVPLTSSIAVWLTVAAAALALAFGFVCVRIVAPAEVSSAHPAYRARGWARSAWPMALVDNLRQVDASYAILLVGMLATDHVTGIFRLALSTSVIAATPLGIFHMVLAPTLARLSAHGQRAELQRVLGVAAGWMFLTMVAGASLLWFAGQWVIDAVFGVAYAEAWLPLMVLMLAQVVNGTFGMGSILLSMGGGERQLTMSYVFSVLVSVVVAAPLIALYGAWGAAAAAVLGALIQNIVAWRAIHSRFGLDSSVLGTILMLRK